MEIEIGKISSLRRIPKISLCGVNQSIFAKIFNRANKKLFEKILKKIVDVGSGQIYYYINEKNLFLNHLFFKLPMCMRLEIYHDIYDEELC